MTTNHSINHLGVALGFTSRQSRSDSLSIVSRQSVLAILVVCLTMLGAGNAWGTESVIYTLTPVDTGTGSTSTGYAGASDASCEDEDTDVTITWNVTGNSNQLPWRIGGNSISNVVRPLYSKTAISDNVTKVVVSYGSTFSLTSASAVLKVYSTAAAAASADATYLISTVNGDNGAKPSSNAIAASATHTFTRPAGHDWTGRYYRFEFTCTYTSNKNKFFELSSAEFYAEPASGYSITYHCNDATSGCPSNASGQDALPSPLPTPTKTGFTFGGWYTNSTLTTAAVAGTTLAADVDLYAKWTCNVTLNRNGATSTVNNVVYGTALDDIDGSSTQGGCSAWTFVGWSKTQRAAQNNSDAMTLATTVDGSGPYYAVYSHTESGGTTTKNYSITFDDNGSDSSTDLTTSTFKDEVSGNADSISSVTSTTKCYPGNGGIKMSSQKYNGSFTLALAHSLPIKKVVLNAKRGGSGTFANGVTVGSTAFSTSSSYSTTSFVDIEFTGTKTTSNSLTVTSTSGSSEGTSNANRITWLASITIYYETSGDVTYYSTTATCCTPLGSINGSFF